MRGRRPAVTGLVAFATLATPVAGAAAAGLLPTGARTPVTVPSLTPPPPSATTAPAPAAVPPPQQAQPAAVPAQPSVRKASARSDRHPVAVAAAPGSVVIRNFAFGPATVTVNVGDTVTWSNQDPTRHTATASDGSFNTGPLAKGQSGSHTFTRAGTFAYICTIHPNMHGTVRVVAASSGGGGGSSGDSGSSGAGSTAGKSSTSGSQSTAAKGPSLPATGGPAGVLAIVGILMVALGAALRRARRTAGG